jgi:protein-tyrosine phosphatase
MDLNNKRDILRIFGGDPKGKVSLLLDYTDEKRDVLDPWWTGDFEATKRDVINGTLALYEYLKNK